MSVDSLIERIELVFPEAPIPQMPLLQAQLCDQTLDREIGEAEWDATGDLDRCINWKNVASATLIECDAALSHITEDGFVYYIPAYMRLAPDVIVLHGSRRALQNLDFGDPHAAEGRVRRGPPI
jgi:hypothetical protein